MRLYNWIQLAFKKYKKSWLTNVSGSHHPTTAMKIAVVGAGLGGCSAARFCREAGSRLGGWKFKASCGRKVATWLEETRARSAGKWWGFRPVCVSTSWNRALRTADGIHIWCMGYDVVIWDPYLLRQGILLLLSGMCIRHVWIAKGSCNVLVRLSRLVWQKNTHQSTFSGFSVTPNHFIPVRLTDDLVTKHQTPLSWDEPTNIA